MPSPFPGMDPYLESPLYWSDFHHEMISAIRALIRAQLPPGFVARLEERLYILNATMRPDVVIVRRPSPALPYVAGRSGAAVLERDVEVTDALSADIPLIIRAYEDTVREAFIEIVAGNEPGRIITTIELLSPANKRVGSGREEYRRKQRDILQSETSLLEIDLLRGGAYTIAAPQSDLQEQSPLYNYVACLHRARAGSVYEAWPIVLRGNLPRIHVPLADSHPDITLDLQAALARAFEAGGYDETLDYTAAPSDPPLSSEDAAWADTLLREKGLR